MVLMDRHSVSTRERQVFLAQGMVLEAAGVVLYSQIQDPRPTTRPVQGNQGQFLFGGDIKIMRYIFTTSTTATENSTGTWQITYMDSNGSSQTFSHPNYIFKSTVLPPRTLELEDIVRIFPTDTVTESIVNYMKENNSSFDDGSRPY